MTLGRTSSGALKIKTDEASGGLRAVGCACCGGGCDFTIETAKTTTISNAYNFNISTPGWSGQFTVPLEEKSYPLLNYKKFCDNSTSEDFLGPCSEDADYIYYYVEIVKYLTPNERVPCSIDGDDGYETWGGTWIEFDCSYGLGVSKDPNKPSNFNFQGASIAEYSMSGGECLDKVYDINWGYELKYCDWRNPLAGGLTAKQAYQGLFEGWDLWTP